MSPPLTESHTRHWPVRAVALAVLSVGIAACGSTATKPDGAASAGPAPVAVQRYQEALGTLQSGDEAQAERQLQALVEAYPGYAGPLANLGMIRARRHELEAAAELLQRAVAACEHCAAPWNQLGIVQRQQGRFPEAERSYLNAIAADAGYANARFNLAVLYELYLQRPDLALDQYVRFREITSADPSVAEVDKWITDLQRRTSAVARSAQLEATP